MSIGEINSLSNIEYDLRVSRGLVEGVSSVIQVGRAPSGIQTTPSDVWSRCDAVPTQQIWIPPTAARVHNIASLSASDNAGGIGAVSVTIYGLTSWTTPQVSETVTLNGVANVATANAYVIIYKMVANAQSTTTNVGVNVGIIRATAQVNLTITAQIDASQGQTQMAIYGIPSTQSLYIKSFWADMNDAAGGARIDAQLRINLNPDVQRLGFISGANILLQNQGSSGSTNQLSITNPIPGPAIIKVQGIGSAADLDMTAGFSAYLIDND